VSMCCGYWDNTRDQNNKPTQWRADGRCCGIGCSHNEVMISRRSSLVMKPSELVSITPKACATEPVRCGSGRVEGATTRVVEWKGQLDSRDDGASARPHLIFVGRAVAGVTRYAGRAEHDIIRCPCENVGAWAGRSGESRCIQPELSAAALYSPRRAH
jgi:hypothetical protein